MVDGPTGQVDPLGVGFRFIAFTFASAILIGRGWGGRYSNFADAMWLTGSFCLFFICFFPSRWVRTRYGFMTTLFVGIGLIMSAAYLVWAIDLAWPDGADLEAVGVQTLFVAWYFLCLWRFWIWGRSQERESV